MAHPAFFVRFFEPAILKRYMRQFDDFAQHVIVDMQGETVELCQIGRAQMMNIVETVAATVHHEIGQRLRCEAIPFDEVSISIAAGRTG